MNLLIFFMGASIGSFFMTAAERGDASVLLGRSRCACGKILTIWELIPVIGYVVQGGRAHCGTKIPSIYPIVEGCTGFFTMLFVRSVGPLEALFFLTLVFPACEDLIRREIHVWALAPAFLIATLALYHHRTLLPALFVVLFFAALAYIGGLGEGDVYVAGVISVFLGPYTVRALILTFLSAGAFALVLLLKGADRKDEVPFVPFFLLGYAMNFWMHVL